MEKASAPSNREKATVTANRDVSYRPVGCHICRGDLCSKSSLVKTSSPREENHLNVLPNIGFGVDDTHIRLISPTIYHHSFIQLQDGITSVILFVN